ncbi:MAG TPA: hypothetical protein VKZ63_08565 [Kofleriaceae bacterium]|nr:hypothetical protein [Kofleriaceae bacterium]
MTLSSRIRRAAFVGALAAAFVLPLGLATDASAQGRRWGPPDRPHRGDHDRGTWDWYGPYRHDLDRYRDWPDRHDRELARFDRDRDGRLNRSEQRAYFQYLAERGVFGRLTRQEITMVSRFGSTFDRNDDGRITGRERRGIRLLIVALRQFERADRDNNRRLSPRELHQARRWLPPPRVLDHNRDGIINRRDVRDSVLEAYRRGRI